MAATTLIRQAAAHVRYLRRYGKRAEARAAAFDARRAIGAVLLRRSVV